MAQDGLSAQVHPNRSPPPQKRVDTFNVNFTYKLQLEP
jgi:hypothetical protein